MGLDHWLAAVLGDGRACGIAQAQYFVPVALGMRAGIDGRANRQCDPAGFGQNSMVRKHFARAAQRDGQDRTSAGHRLFERAQRERPQARRGRKRSLSENQDGFAPHQRFFQRVCLLQARLAALAHK